MIAASGLTNIDTYLLGKTSKNSLISSNGKVATGLKAVSTVKDVLSGTKDKLQQIARNPVIAQGTIFMPGTIGNNIRRIIAYLLAIIIVILIILLFIHFFIKPIFKIRPGSPGIIPIPGSDDGVLFWNTKIASDIEEKDLKMFYNIYFNYTLILDIFIENPVYKSTVIRTLFSRGAVYKSQPSKDDISPLAVFSKYNLIIALAPNNTDMIVSVLTKTPLNPVIAYIPNVPVQEPFRLGIVVLELALEVYINGRLMKTIKYDSGYTLEPYIEGGIKIAKGGEKNIAKLRNLKIWNKVLSIPEIRYAKPDMSTTKDFDAKQMDTSKSCDSNIINYE